MTIRLSANSFAGTARTLVAVGTVSDAFMFLTTLAAAPRRGDCVPAATGAALAAGFSAAGFVAGALWTGLAAGALSAGSAAEGWAARVGCAGAAAGFGWSGFASTVSS